MNREIHLVDLIVVGFSKGHVSTTICLEQGLSKARSIRKTHATPKILAKYCVIFWCLYGITFTLFLGPDGCECRTLIRYNSKSIWPRGKEILSAKLGSKLDICLVKILPPRRTFTVSPVKARCIRDFSPSPY